MSTVDNIELLLVNTTYDR